MNEEVKEVAKNLKEARNDKNSNLKFDKELNNIIKINEGIINGLMTQKARQDDMLEKYEEAVDKEISLPSNRFLDWSKMVSPYIDWVRSSKISDFQIMESYEKFVKELLEYQDQVTVNEEEMEEFGVCFDQTVENILRLENKIINLKKFFASEMDKMRKHSRSLFSVIPEDFKNQEGICLHCGCDLSEDQDEHEVVCVHCKDLTPPKIPKSRYIPPDKREKEVVKETKLASEAEEHEKEETAEQPKQAQEEKPEYERLIEEHKKRFGDL